MSSVSSYYSKSSADSTFSRGKYQRKDSSDSEDSEVPYSEAESVEFSGEEDEVTPARIKAVRTGIKNTQKQILRRSKHLKVSTRSVATCKAILGTTLGSMPSKLEAMIMTSIEEMDLPTHKKFKVFLNSLVECLAYHEEINQLTLQVAREKSHLKSLVKIMDRKKAREVIQDALETIGDRKELKKLLQEMEGTGKTKIDMEGAGKTKLGKVKEVSLEELGRKTLDASHKDLSKKDNPMLDDVIEASEKIAQELIDIGKSLSPTAREFFFVDNGITPTLGGYNYTMHGESGTSHAICFIPDSDKPIPKMTKRRLADALRHQRDGLPPNS
jgi:hypothetical protein